MIWRGLVSQDEDWYGRSGEVRWDLVGTGTVRSGEVRTGVAGEITMLVRIFENLITAVDNVANAHKNIRQEIRKLDREYLKITQHYRKLLKKEGTP